MKATRKRDPLKWLRAKCDALAGVEEKPAWGHPTFRAGGKTIAAYEIIRGRPSIAVLARLDQQDLLVDEFGLFKTPYGARYGWVSAWVDVPARWDILGGLLKDAYAAATAPRRRRK